MNYKGTAARPRRSKKSNSASSAVDAKQFVVKHNYHDHSHDQSNSLTGEDEIPKRKGPRGGVTVPFPVKLHLMLSRIEEEGLGHIVSWQPHGRCFQVHKPKEFVDEIMPTFFRQSKLTSFQRQLNLYGFSRITAGRDRGGYYHELFLRNKLFLCQNMTRIRIKGTGIKGKANPSSEPDFYSMPPIVPEDEEECRNLEVQLEAAMEEENRRTNKSSTFKPRNKSKTSKRRASLAAKNVAAKKVYSMSAPLVSPDTPEKPPVEHCPTSPVISMRRRLSQNQTYDHLNPPFMAPPLQPGDDVMFEGQHFRYMDSMVNLAEEQPFALKPRSSIISLPSLPLEQTLNEPILTPSSSSSSLSEFFQQHEPSIDFNPATVFQEKEAEIIRDRSLMIA